jgi:RNA-directed DNA polymerase
VVAYRKGDKREWYRLQKKLMFSFEARALAVKKITSNKGEKTPGVDNIIWNTPWEKYLATQQLKTYYVTK